MQPRPRPSAYGPGAPGSVAPDISRETLATRYSPQPRKMLSKKRGWLDAERDGFSDDPAGQSGGDGWAESMYEQ